MPNHLPREAEASTGGGPPCRLVLLGLDGRTEALWRSAARACGVEPSIADAATALRPFADGAEPLVLVAHATTGLEPGLLDPTDKASRHVPVLLLADEHLEFWDAVAWQALPPSATASDAISALGSAFEEATRRLTELRIVNDYHRNRDKLSPDERDVLEAVCDGRLNKQIAREANVSVRTIEQRRRRVFQTMGVEAAVPLARLCGRVEAIEGRWTRVRRRIDSPPTNPVTPPAAMGRSRRLDTRVSSVIGAAAAAAQASVNALG